MDKKYPIIPQKAFVEHFICNIFKKFNETLNTKDKEIKFLAYIYLLLTSLIFDKFMCLAHINC